MMSWVERKMAAALFAVPPTATIDEALCHFMQVCLFLCISIYLSMGFPLSSCYYLGGKTDPTDTVCCKSCYI